MEDIITSGKKLSTKFHFLVNSFKKDIYRRHCYLCQAVYSSHLCVCEACFWDLPWKQCSCLRCGLPIATNWDSSLQSRLHYPAAGEQFPIEKVEVGQHFFRNSCLECTAAPFEFDRCITPLTYSFPIGEIIHQFKYQKRRYWRYFLNDMLMLYLKAFRSDLYDASDYPTPELIIPVPISAAKLFQREFNQSHGIASKLAQAFAAPIAQSAISTSFRSVSQASLSRSQRLTHSQDAFQAGNQFAEIRGKSIMIVDDVITTGSTANQIARLAKKAGATSVEVWGIARTPKTGPTQ